MYALEPDAHRPRAGRSTNHVYEDLATKFFEHFLDIAHAMADMAVKTATVLPAVGLWDEQDQFYYDMLNLPSGDAGAAAGALAGGADSALRGGGARRLRRGRSVFPAFRGAPARWLLSHRPDLAEQVSRWEEPGKEQAPAAVAAAAPTG